METEYPHRQINKGTVTYKMKYYEDGDSVNLKPGDIIAGIDPNTGYTWILERQEVRP